jgi:putative hydrolase of the HAD superfamily
MTGAVIFDFYGTLARWQDRHDANYPAVFAAHGYQLSDDILTAYFDRYDGVAHAEHSVNATTYEAWVRSRLGDLAIACEVAEVDRGRIVEALRFSDRDAMVAYPEAAPTLRALRENGWLIGVCSNWGWELNSFLEQVELLSLVDSAVTSARAGARKPHPIIFQHAIDLLGVAFDEVVFVGDSWRPDVEGAIGLGMTAVHVWRPEERGELQPPELVAGAYRVGDLSEIPMLLSSLSLG